MCPLSNNTRSNSNNIFHIKKRDVAGPVKWETLGNSEGPKNLVDIVNKKVLLSSLFKKYNILFEKRYSASGWILVTKCPFNDHYDKAPSFGYNPKKNIFNCFGCNRGGGPVQFLSFLNNESLMEVASTLARGLSISDDIDIDLGPDYDKIERLLFDYAEYVLCFRNKFNTRKANKYIESVTWNLDVYLNKHVILESIDVENLNGRIIKLKEQLDLFEED
jgi:DNA primase